MNWMGSETMRSVPKSQGIPHPSLGAAPKHPAGTPSTKIVKDSPLDSSTEALKALSESGKTPEAMTSTTSAALSPSDRMNSMSEGLLGRTV